MDWTVSGEVVRRVRDPPVFGGLGISIAIYEGLLEENEVIVFVHI